MQTKFEDLFKDQSQSLEIGELITRLIALQADKENLGLTDFTAKMSTVVGISSRHISRIEDLSFNFPKGDAVLKIAQYIPEVGILDPNTIARRILWQDYLAFSQLHKPNPKNKTEIKVTSRNILSNHVNKPKYRNSILVD